MDVNATKNILTVGTTGLAFEKIKNNSLKGLGIYRLL